MALPTILIDSATGSDTAASGAGPATALTGTNASFAAAVVTLDGSPDLSGVATDGSNVLYLVTSTGVAFFKITATDNSAKTVTVTPNPAGTSTGRTWAIGGKRQTIGSTSSRLLVENAGAAGDAQPGWVIELADGHAETLTAALLLRCVGDVTTGPITLRGALAASVKPRLTFNLNAICLRPIGNYNIIENIELRNTNATKTASVAVYSNATTPLIVRQLTIANSTDKFWMGIQSGSMEVDRCEIAYTASYGISLLGGTASSIALRYCYLHDTGNSCLFSEATNTVNQLTAVGNIFTRTASGAGVSIRPSTSLVPRSIILANAFDANTGDGLELLGANAEALSCALIENNIFSNNGGYGINAASLTAIVLRARAARLRANDFYLNTSGKYTPSDIESLSEQTLDPQYTDAANGDFSIGTNLKELGSPLTDIGT